MGNGKSSDDIANSNKDYNSKRQQEKLENQTVFPMQENHTIEKYEESRLQNENLNAATNRVTSLNNSNLHKWPKDTVFIVGDIGN